VHFLRLGKVGEEKMGREGFRKKGKKEEGYRCDAMC
jgi:hypothetical protein